ncbi:hypothetical protein [Allosphingosinicella indica]|uniref:Uncharacterized protein n=1 Tax=Allosphingosinicella indica TaxID=941907 RepID=A0A1X7G901_9SPHN|nr:hypothetical protein [Allosphingosinicella indica]SMF66058.1 hypothetical protein SAMN06295910_1361 [Allosphingosinicella indica]
MPKLETIAFVTLGMLAPVVMTSVALEPVQAGKPKVESVQKCSRAAMAPMCEYVRA